MKILRRIQKAWKLWRARGKFKVRDVVVYIGQDEPPTDRLWEQRFINGNLYRCNYLYGADNDAEIVSMSIVSMSGVTSANRCRNNFIKATNRK